MTATTSPSLSLTFCPNRLQTKVNEIESKLPITAQRRTSTSTTDNTMHLWTFLCRENTMEGGRGSFAATPTISEYFFVAKSQAYYVVGIQVAVPVVDKRRLLQRRRHACTMAEHHPTSPAPCAPPLSPIAPRTRFPLGCCLFMGPAGDAAASGNRSAMAHGRRAGKPPRPSRPRRRG